MEAFSRLTRINGQEGIYLSGIGVGTGYEFELMDQLTDAGKGAHVFLPNAEEVDLIFGDYLPKLIEDNLSSVEKNWPKDLPKGIIHADLFHDNIFFIQDKFNGIIDFYFSCEDFFAFEIAICFNALCFDGLKSNLSFNVTKAKNFIDGYTATRKLTDEELSCIKVLSQGAALRFLLTRVFDALNKVEGAIVKIKDPMEYLKRLEFHKNAKNHEDYFF